MPLLFVFVTKIQRHARSISAPKNVILQDDIRCLFFLLGIKTPSVICIVGLSTLSIVGSTEIVFFFVISFFTSCSIFVLLSSMVFLLSGMRKRSGNPGLFSSLFSFREYCTWLLVRQQCHLQEASDIHPLGYTRKGFPSLCTLQLVRYLCLSCSLILSVFL